MATRKTRSKAKRAPRKPAKSKSARNARKSAAPRRTAASARKRAPSKRATSARKPARAAKKAAKRPRRQTAAKGSARKSPTKTARTAAPPRATRAPLSAERKKLIAGEHLRDLLEQKKQRQAQLPAWQRIEHHDRTPRAPETAAPAPASHPGLEREGDLAESVMPPKPATDR